MIGSDPGQKHLACKMEHLVGDHLTLGARLGAEHGGNAFVEHLDATNIGGESNEHGDPSIQVRMPKGTLVSLVDDMRFKTAIERIDAANAGDPRGKELLYSQRMTECLGRLEPGASEALRLAARAQHVRRWEVPRDSFPMDRQGYLDWRKKLYGFHADVTESILRDVGYDEGITRRVRDLLMKKRLKADAEMQTLEDVICLVFLEHYFEEFMAEHGQEEAKIVNILRRTWAKMSDRGHEAALQLPLSGRAKELVALALAG